MKNDPQQQNNQGKSFDTPQHFFREIEIQFLIHEMKDPLSIIETGLRTLLDRKDKFGGLSAPQEKTLKRTLRNAVKAREMLNSLLEIGRSESGVCISCQFDAVKTIAQVLAESLEMQSDVSQEDLGSCENLGQFVSLLEKHHILLSIPDKPVQFLMCQDENRFRQIFGNLLKNALYHRKKTIVVKLNQSDDSLTLEVTDDGPGIDPQHHELVFRRYAQVIDSNAGVPRKGHGLGLAGALIMARSLGGDIQLRSTAGSGATFIMVIPMTLKESPPDPSG
ncbi:MAG: HAMP domain-containing sensor histidine kinase [Thermodesulfobacteriota bacterium]